MAAVTIDYSESVKQTLPNLIYDEDFLPSSSATSLAYEDLMGSRSQFIATTVKFADSYLPATDSLLDILGVSLLPSIKADPVIAVVATAFPQTEKPGRKITRQQAQQIAIQGLLEAEKRRQTDRLQEAEALAASWEEETTKEPPDK